MRQKRNNLALRGVGFRWPNRWATASFEQQLWPNRWATENQAIIGLCWAYVGVSWASEPSWTQMFICIWRFEAKKWLLDWPRLGLANRPLGGNKKSGNHWQLVCLCSARIPFSKKKRVSPRRERYFEIPQGQEEAKMELRWD